MSHRGFGDVFRRVDEIDWTLEQILSGTNPNPITSPCLHYEEDDFFFNPYGYVVVAGEA